MPQGLHCSCPKYADRRRLRQADWAADRSLTGIQPFLEHGLTPPVNRLRQVEIVRGKSFACKTYQRRTHLGDISEHSAAGELEELLLHCS